MKEGRSTTLTANSPGNGKEEKKTEKDDPTPEDKEKEEKKRERQALESRPLLKARIWLKDIVTTISTARKCHNEANDEQVKKMVPSAPYNEFQSMFDGHNKNITESAACPNLRELKAKRRGHH